jgi:hypothetical protein
MRPGGASHRAYDGVAVSLAVAVDGVDSVVAEEFAVDCPL